MEKEIKKLEQLVNAAGKIFITSHIGPDGDSVCSSLLLLNILRLNFQNKEVSVVIEEQPYGLNFLEGIEDIKIENLLDSLHDIQPDLIIVLDANTISRVTRQPDAVRSYISENNPTLIIIDHHEPVGIEDNQLYINNMSPAVTLDIYEIFIKKLRLKKPGGYAQAAINGIYTDTGGFVNRNLNYKKTFEVLPDLVDDGANIELVANEINRINDKGLDIFKVFINNLKLADDHVYTFLDDSVLNDGEPSTVEAVKQASDLIRTAFLRNIGNRKWGYIVYRDMLADKRTYSVSFRSVSGVKDVSQIASKLKGGGHKPAAGAKIEAGSVNEALKMINEAIAA